MQQKRSMYDRPKLLHHGRKNSRLTLVIDEQKFLGARDETHLTNSGTLVAPRRQIDRMAPGLEGTKLFIEYKYVNLCLKKLFSKIEQQTCSLQTLTQAWSAIMRLCSSKAITTSFPVFSWWMTLRWRPCRVAFPMLIKVSRKMDIAPLWSSVMSNNLSLERTWQWLHKIFSSVPQMPSRLTGSCDLQGAGMTKRTALWDGALEQI